MGYQRERVAAGRDVPSTCPACGAGGLSFRRVLQTFKYGEGAEGITLSATVEIGTCSACGLEFTRESAERARHDAVCRHLGVMTPGEIRALRNSYVLTQSEFARLTRIGEASLSRWENSLSVQNGGYDQFLYLLTFPENLERLRQHLQTSAVATAKSLSGSHCHGKFRSLQVTPEVLGEASQFELRPTGTEG
jgi:DNA-binding transcriptional regulator YiaG